MAPQQVGKIRAYPPLSGRETSQVGYVLLKPGESVVWTRDGNNNVIGYQIIPAPKK